jgi:adenine-specific DNA-methyltransferase
MDQLPVPQSTATTPPSVSKLDFFQKMFPGVVRDGVLDASQLGALLDVPVAGLKDGRERFGLLWAGKKNAVEALQMPSYASLVPDTTVSVNWTDSENVFVEGDNLEVLKLLQNAYNDQIKLIYIDPPYNTGNDFVYNDDFSDPVKRHLEVTGQVDSEGNRLVANTDVSGRKHSNWLSMMYPRLVLARNLLTQDGVICISIDDNEVHNLRSILDEIFGPENFVAQLIWKSKSGGANDTKNIAIDHEYVLVYARNEESLSVNPDFEAEVTTSYSREDEKGPYSLERLDKQNLGYQKTLDFPIIGPDGTEYRVHHKDPSNPQARWRWGATTVAERYSELVFEKGQVYTKNYRKEGAIPRSLLVDDRFGRTRTGSTEVAALMGGPFFDNPKSTRLLGHLVRLFTNDGDTVLDFFAGSGTTAHAVHLENEKGVASRKYILVTLDEPTDPKSYARLNGLEKVSEITIARLRAFHSLSDSGGFRVFRLGPSAFGSPAHLEEEQDLFNVSSLRAKRSKEELAHEMLLNLGVELGARIQTLNIDKVKCWVSGNVLIQVEGEPTLALTDLATEFKCSVIAILEDEFAGKDSLKSNLFFACKKLNITLKTF